MVMIRTTGKRGDLANISLIMDGVGRVLIVNSVTRKMSVPPGNRMRGAKMTLLPQEANV
jgi:hypothetical protein